MPPAAKSSPKYLKVVVILLLIVGGSVWFCIPLIHDRARNEVEAFEKSHPEWIADVSKLTASLANYESDTILLHEKEAVHRSMPAEIALAVVEKSDVPLLSAKYKDPSSYRVILNSESGYWLTYGAFKYEGGEKWGRVLSSWIEPEPGKRYRLLLFLEN